MELQTRKKQVLSAVALLVLLAITASACSFTTTSVGPVTQMVEISIDQEQFDQALQHSTMHMDGPYDRLLDKVTAVEIHDGLVRYEGTKTLADGSQAAGSFDLSVAAENDMLKARIIAVDIPGVDLNDARILKANAEMEAELAEMLSDSSAQVLFKEVTATEGNLRLKLLVYID
jgi:hypothetical protein